MMPGSAGDAMLAKALTIILYHSGKLLVSLSLFVAVIVIIIITILIIAITSIIVIIINFGSAGKSGSCSASNIVIML